jgi:CHAT domain-containing protein/Tfp pilus assembly protein PilF
MPVKLLQAFVLAATLIAASCGVQRESTALDPALEAVIATYRQDGAEPALPKFEQLAKEFADGGKRRDEAAAIHYIGECHWRLGNFDEARRQFDRALALESELGYRHGIGKTINSIGLLEWDLGNYDEAKERFLRAGVLARQVGDEKLEGATFNNLGLVHDELGDYKTSLEHYQKALDIYARVDFPRGRGDTLGNLGGVNLLLGRYQDGLERYQQAFAISQSIESKPSMSQDHGNIALCLLGLGKIDEALPHFDEAIRLAREAGMRQDEAYWSRGKASALIQKGLYDQGLALHKSALAIYEEVKAQAELAEALHDMGELYLLLGDPDTAEHNFSRALAVSESIELSRGITTNLMALGDIALRRKHFAEARQNYAKASKRAADSGEKHLQATGRLRLALVFREERRLDLAAAEISNALELAREINSPATEAEALYTLADLERRRGQSTRALESYSAAQAAIEPIGDPDILWQIHYGRALTQKQLGDLKAAESSLVAALTVIEGVRSRLREQRFRAGYLQDKYDVYVDLVRLQLELGRTADAFRTAERLRARSYAEQLGGRSTAPLSVDSRQQENRLRGRIQQLQNALSDELAQEEPASRQIAVTTVSHELLAAEKEYQVFLDDLGVMDRGHGASEASPDAATVQTRLRSDEALIEFVVGHDSVMAFVLTPKGVFAKTIRIARSDLTARVELLRDLLSRPGTDQWLGPAHALSARLIEPLQMERWLANVRQLYVVPHDVLNYVPFALLPNPQAGSHKLLVDTYSIAFLPTAAVLLRDARPPGSTRSLLALAPSRSRLRHAIEEVRSIDAFYKPHSQILEGQQATEGKFKSVAAQFAVLHFATHGLFNRINPMMSGIELESDATDDGLLQVHEVLALRLTADLVTLSACDSALASGFFNEVPAGDEFVGMARAFLSAGSQSVMATLWEVDDLSSVTLMHSFYQHLAGANRSNDKAGALAEAQRELRSSARLSHPYYWAPFVMIGGVNHANRAETAT